MASVTISWKDNSKNETGFEVQRCQGVTCENFVQIAITAPNVITYTDSALLSGTTYRYRVRALKGRGKSSFSNTLTVVTASSPPTTSLTITCPANVAVETNSPGGKVVNFNLAVAAGGVPPYTILMNPPSGSTFPVGVTTVNANVIDAAGATTNCSFTVTVTYTEIIPPPQPPALVITCPPNQTLIATAGTGIVATYAAPTAAGGTPPYSITTVPTSGSLFPVGITQVTCRVTDSLGVIATCTFTITVTLLIPADPSSLTATTNASGFVALAWTDNAISESGFVIERKLSTSSVFTALITTSANAVAYIDNTVSRGLIYNYRVKAINSGGSSGYSNTATASVPPAAPTNLQATAGNTSVTLGWNSVANVTYTLLRGTVNGGPYGTTVVTGLASPGYTNTGLTNGVTYYYVVVSVNAAGTSSNSNQASATPQAVLPDANWYISPTGSDSNSGLTPVVPFLNFTKLATVINPGQIAGIRGGNFNQRIESFPSGTAVNPIILRNYNSEVPWLKPTSGTGHGAIWLDLEIEYVMWDGLNVDMTGQNLNEECIWFSTNNGHDPRHLTFKNAEVICSSNAIGGGAILLGNHTNIGATGGHLFQDIIVHGGGLGTLGNYGIYIAGPNNIIDGFDIYDTVLGGMQIYNGSGDPSNNNIVRNGRIHDIRIEPVGNRYWGILVSGDNNLVANVTVDNNNETYVSANSAFAQYYGSGNKYLFCLATKNTGLGSFNISNLADNTVIRNCIGYQNVYDTPINGSPSTIMDHNLFAIDPLFVNIATGNYHLLTGSPARSIGLYQSSVPTDRDGVVRANPPDVGPYQFV